MQKLYLPYILSLIAITSISAKPLHSHNGQKLFPQGTVRVFLVFAEPDTSCNLYNDQRFISGNWKPGTFPDNAASLFDIAFSDSLQGAITQYYAQSSLEKLQIIGDYLPYLVQFPSDKLGKSFAGDLSVVASVLDTISLFGGDLETKHGYSLENGDFDLIGDPKSKKPSKPDGRIDLLLVILRCHPTIGSNSGFGSSSRSMQIKSMRGFNSATLLVSPSLDRQIICHEIAHFFMGSNAFHNGGNGAGSSKLPYRHAGHSVLSSSGSNLNGPNAWDRYRLNWSKRNSRYPISDAYGKNADIDLDSISNDTISIVLRDFLKYGDAARIKIPYSGHTAECPKCEEQWLWLENYQMLTGGIATNDCLSKGIRANIQIGNESFYRNSTGINYYVPIINRKKYDFDIASTDGAFCKLLATSSQENPLTGRAISDYQNKYEQTTTVFGLEGRQLLPASVTINGKELKEDSCCYQQYPNFGTLYDAFSIGDSITMSTNPTITTLTTQFTGKTKPANNKAKNNKYSNLSGLGIYIIDSVPMKNCEGNAIKIIIKKNDYSVSGHNRWCGSIILRDTVKLLPHSSTTLDWGESPVRTENPLKKNGKTVFSSPTTFTCNQSSLVLIEKDATLHLKAGSSFIVDSLATISMKEKSKIVIEDSSSVSTKSGSAFFFAQKASIELLGNATISLLSGTYIQSSASAVAIFSGRKKVPLFRILKSQAGFSKKDLQAGVQLEKTVILKSY